MEQVKSYINKDLYGQTYEQFCENLNLGIDLENEPIEGKIEWVLLLLDKKMYQARTSEDINPIRISHFDGCHLMVDRVQGDNENIKEMVYLKPTESGLNFKLFNEPFNVKILNFSDHFNLMSFKELAIEDKRGICLPNEYAYCMEYAYFTKDEKWYSLTQNFKLKSIFSMKGKIKEQVDKYLEENNIQRGRDVTIKGKTYSWEGFVKMLDNNYPVPIANKSGYILKEKDINNFLSTDTYYNDYVEKIQTAISFKLTHHYEWHLYIKENEDSIGFQIPVSPNVFKEVDFLKNIERGEKRKKAIIHFVSEHKRRLKEVVSNIEKEILVHKYLRGETKFNWNGLIVNLIPSKSDIINTNSKKKFLTV